jgi:hypothetical protein
MKPAAPRRPLNPFVLRRAVASGINQGVLSQASGFPAYSTYYTTLRSPIVIATDLTVARLTRLAEIIGFPTDEIFLDEPRSVKRVPTTDSEAEDAEAR